MLESLDVCVVERKHPCGIFTYGSTVLDKPSIEKEVLRRVTAGHSKDAQSNGVHWTKEDLQELAEKEA